jgi:para-nitrobenzyl esterase
MSVQEFLGIRYAEPPTGERRFAKPVPVDGAEPLGHFGTIAPQPTSGRGMAGQLAPEPQDEDCLFLNVWTPGRDPEARRPVMVWIHGGAFVTGSGSGVLYRGGQLADRGDVVVVTINYRLGALGFLGGNWGLFDQIAALEWVQDNIAAFGGDPDNVTIFGESAGAFSVGALLGAPAAQPFFHRAIAQSGGPAAQPADVAAEHVSTFVEHAGVASFDDLRELPVEAIMATQLAMTPAYVGAGLPFAPSVDGDLFPEPPLDAIAAGLAAGKEILVGTNVDEMTYFAVGNRKLTGADEAYALRALARGLGSEDAAAEAYDAYAAARADRGWGTSPFEIWTGVESDRVFRLPVLRMAESHAATGSAVFEYLFEWRSPAMGGVLGACHALEIAFVFGTLTTPGVELFTGGGSDALALSAKMQDAWLAFARTGNPSTPELGEWPRYDGARRSTMVLGPDARVEDAPMDEERAFWDGRSIGRYRSAG